MLHKHKFITSFVLPAGDMTAIPALIQERDRFPSNGSVIHGLYIRVVGSAVVAAVGGATILANGVARFIRSIQLDGDVRKNIYRCTGKDLAILNLLNAGVPAAQTLPGGVAGGTAAQGAHAFDLLLHIPFARGHGARPVDCAFDTFKERLSIVIQPGNAADLLSGDAAATIAAGCTVEMYADVDDSPKLTDLPIFTPSFERILMQITGTTPNFSFLLPTGDRIYNRLVTHQETLATQAAISSLITGNLGLRVNQSDFIKGDNVPFAFFHQEMVRRYRLQAADVPVGLAVFDFFERGKISDSLESMTKTRGNVELLAGVAGNAGDDGVILMDCVKAIPPELRRPNQPSTVASVAAPAGA